MGGSGDETQAAEPRQRLRWADLSDYEDEPRVGCIQWSLGSACAGLTWQTLRILRKTTSESCHPLRQGFDAACWIDTGSSCASFPGLSFTSLTSTSLTLIVNVMIMQEQVGCFWSLSVNQGQL